MPLVRQPESLIERENKKKYLKAPSIEQLVKFIHELGITDVQFEIFYNIPKNTISVVKAGMRRLPPAYWHFVYEKIVPTYGLGYKKETYNYNRTNRKPNNSVEQEKLSRLVKI